jgi:hypothetical protein
MNLHPLGIGSSVQAWKRKGIPQGYEQGCCFGLPGGSCQGSQVFFLSFAGGRPIRSRRADIDLCMLMGMNEPERRHAKAVSQPTQRERWEAME